MARARVTTATAVKPGLLRNTRSPYRKSWPRVPMNQVPLLTPISYPRANFHRLQAAGTPFRGPTIMTRIRRRYYEDNSCRSVSAHHNAFAETSSPAGLSGTDLKPRCGFLTSPKPQSGIYSFDDKEEWP